MNQTMFKRVYDSFRNYIMENSRFNPLVLRKPSTTIFPNVVITKITDRALMVNDPHSLMGIEINIYAKDMEYDGEIILDIDICEEIEGLTDRYFGNTLKFIRILDTPTPNIDNNIYRITMQYIKAVSDNRCRFY